jgi:hypothetical protein
VYGEEFTFSLYLTSTPDTIQLEPIILISAALTRTLGFLSFLSSRSTTRSTNHIVRFMLTCSGVCISNREKCSGIHKYHSGESQ